MLVYDDEVTGFGVFILRSGKRGFFLRYRIAGRERRFTIGAWPTWSVTAAREEAKRLKREVDAGNDPLGADALAPAGHRRAIERQGVLEVGL
ncbi:Arm DNA-binding domain-containing protein, partial [Elioraea sp. Yellowstone]|uniref:Arm DNA-binding domain-containing protein n=1 Tax=Elioraea sp. Yellowstone TaxID=2592070 RepID=UPI001F439841